jgi:hypothetical protein
MLGHWKAGAPQFRRTPAVWRRVWLENAGLFGVYIARDGKASDSAPVQISNMR